MKPDHCTSTDVALSGSCKDFENGYCPKCSHALYFGEGKDRNGKLWRWEFNPMFGPEFLRKDGEFLAKQPVYENHPAWEPFEKWQEGIKCNKGGINGNST
ncbi:hypothetical protein LCGC14_1109620 [marine sediment metagenome]|uniref:Uncharacterized protein n=1 Tax=marine sediment metagenome TaxID=412755 RepID=A0A0F9M729_9ZZZZ|nr:hypothetical protein [Pricia sp.]